MRQTFRAKFGIWLERFTFLHPVLLKFSHEYPEGQAHYVNRISRTFAKKGRRP